MHPAEELLAGRLVWGVQRRALAVHIIDEHVAGVEHLRGEEPIEEAIEQHLNEWVLWLDETVNGGEGEGRK